MHSSRVLVPTRILSRHWGTGPSKQDISQTPEVRYCSDLWPVTWPSQLFNIVREVAMREVPLQLVNIASQVATWDLATATCQCCETSCNVWYDHWNLSELWDKLQYGTWPMEIVNNVRQVALCVLTTVTCQSCETSFNMGHGHCKLSILWDKVQHVRNVWHDPWICQRCETSCRKCCIIQHGLEHCCENQFRQHRDVLKCLDGWYSMWTSVQFAKEWQGLKLAVVC